MVTLRELLDLVVKRKASDLHLNGWGASSYQD